MRKHHLSEHDSGASTTAGAPAGVFKHHKQDWRRKMETYQYRGPESFAGHHSPVDHIIRGDHVSWRLPGESSMRGQGIVVRRTTKDFMPAYAVTDSDGIGRVIPARFITKEVG
jgi:hypothetical protein